MTMATGTDGDNQLGAAHVRTYEGFMSYLKWGVAVVAIILILMAIFLVH
jgi:uncharacterized integral membrane protein